MKMPAFDRCRSARPSATCPCSSSTGTTRICAIGTARAIAARTNGRMWLSDWRFTGRLRSEPDLEPDLHDALIVTGDPRERVRNRHQRVPGNVGGDHAVHRRYVLPVEEILGLEEQLGAGSTRKRHEARVAQVEVQDSAEAAGIPLEPERPIVGETVAVEIQIQSDVERQAAVPLEDERQLIVAREDIEE